MDDSVRSIGYFCTILYDYQPNKVGSVIDVITVYIFLYPVRNNVYGGKLTVT